jgi:hypothetical protein
MREYTVRLGGKERVLFFDTPERRAIEHAFAYEGQPARMLDLIQNHFRPDQPGSFEVQTTILWAGIRKSKRGLTVEETGLWISAELKAGRHIAELIVPALRAIGESGCLGFTFSLPEEGVDEPEPDAGKAPGEPTEDPPEN